MLTFHCWMCGYEIKLADHHPHLTCPRCLTEKGRVRMLRAVQGPLDVNAIVWLPDRTAYLGAEHVRCPILAIKPDAVAGQRVGEMYGTCPRDAMHVAAFVALACTHYARLRASLAKATECLTDFHANDLAVFPACERVIKECAEALASSEWKELQREAT